MARRTARSRPPRHFSGAEKRCSVRGGAVLRPVGLAKIPPPRPRATSPFDEEFLHDYERSLQLFLFAPRSRSRMIPGYAFWRFGKLMLIFVCRKLLLVSQLKAGRGFSRNYEHSIFFCIFLSTTLKVFQKFWYKVTLKLLQRDTNGTIECMRIICS